MTKYFIATFGCQMNKSDSERIANVLSGLGFLPAPKMDQADLVVVNMCSVRQSAVDRASAQIKNAKNKLSNKKCKIILTGCILNKNKRELNKFCNGIFTIDQLSELPKMLKKMGLKIKINKTPKTKHYLEIMPKYQSSSIAYVPIMTGCNNFCSYCVVPYARGRETSRPAEEIICQIKNLVQKGVKEVWLLGQNVNSYGINRGITRKFTRNNTEYGRKNDAEINFAKLLQMVNDISGNFWIRFTSSHPKDLGNELIKTMAKCSKVTPYINLPIQSGDDDVLKKMNRPYSAEHYKKIVKKLKNDFKKHRKGLEKELALSTDVIVGFPKETKKQFENTKKTLKNIKFFAAYVSRYSPRPQTAAFKLKDDVDAQEKKKREKELVNVVEKSALNFNKKFLNKIVDVLILKKKNDYYLGKTRHFQTIKIKSENNILNKIIQAKVTKIMPYGLEGKIFAQNRAKLKKSPENPRQYWAEKGRFWGTVPLIVVLGPTASGKSELARELACWLQSSPALILPLPKAVEEKRAGAVYGAEIISADSRQVYLGMDIGTGKIPRDKPKTQNQKPKTQIKNQKIKIQIKDQNNYFYKGINHHLLDIASPKRRFTAAQFKKKAEDAIKKIHKSNKIPILCGGTGLYIQAVIDDWNFPQVKPNLRLRKKLEKQSLENLYQQLKKLDPKRAKTIDQKNKRRLIRALEIVLISKKPVPKIKAKRKYNTFIIGIKKDKRELQQSIEKRLKTRLGQGMIAEVKKLNQSGLSWKRLEEFGLEYRWIAHYLQNKISKKEMIEGLKKDIENYAKRQMTWFKKYNPDACWIKNISEAKTLLKKFLKN